MADAMSRNDRRHQLVRSTTTTALASDITMVSPSSSSRPRPKLICPSNCLTLLGGGAELTGPARLQLRAGNVAALTLARRPSDNTSVGLVASDG